MGSNAVDVVLSHLMQSITKCETLSNPLALEAANKKRLEELLQSIHVHASLPPKLMVNEPTHLLSKREDVLVSSVKRITDCFGKEDLIISNTFLDREVTCTLNLPETPLHLACANGHADVVRFLAGKKCKLNPHGMYKKTPLMLAVQHQHKDCVTALLEHGADADHKGAGGNTALHMAALMPSKAMVELLLEHNAQIDARNDLGYTPLALAIVERREEMVEFLLQNGADVNARDIQQRTPLQIAGYAGNTNVVRLLLQHGAVLSHRDQDGFTDMGYLDHFTSGFSKTLQEYSRSKRTGECSVGGAGGATVPEISSSGTTAASPVGAAAQSGAGVLPEAGGEQEEDFDSLSDFETDSEGPMALLDAVLLPGAKQQGACAHPVAEERHNGVLPAAGAAQDNDDESPFESETDSEGLTELLDAVLLPAAKQQGACAHPVAEERHNGVLPAAGAAQEEEEDFDFSSLDEVLCLPELAELLRFLSPAAARQCDAAALLRIPLLTVCRSVFLLAQDFALEREERPLKKEASTQTDGQGDTQAPSWNGQAGSHSPATSQDHGSPSARPASLSKLIRTFPFRELPEPSSIFRWGNLKVFPESLGETIFCLLLTTLRLPSKSCCPVSQPSGFESCPMSL
ncbi:uncharacterized protein [Patagioenas fasciata]|uniref:uncharacterized protein isoform X3 n=1 Tax=Patagioenas fasciata TaxID=372321 RepID=UPI003A994756